MRNHVVAYPRGPEFWSALDSPTAFTKSGISSNGDGAPLNRGGTETPAGVRLPFVSMTSTAGGPHNTKVEYVMSKSSKSKNVETSKFRIDVTSLPDQKLPPGLYLIHNHVTPTKPLGRNGFRAWIADKSDNLEPCNCGFGGCPNARVNPHYRVAGFYR